MVPDQPNTISSCSANPSFAKQEKISLQGFFYLPSDTQHACIRRQGHGYANTNGLKGDQRKMRKKNRATARFILFVLLALGFLLPGVGLHVCNAYSEQKVEKQDNYPATPEGVVEAYVKAGFEGTGVEEIGDVQKRLQYTIWKTWPGSDSNDISLKYKIAKIRENEKEATVKVSHECLGWVAFDLIEIERKTEEIEYKLVKEKGFWRIAFPDHARYISVKTAIKMLEWGIEFYKKDTERVKKMRNNIAILKTYL